MTSLVTRPLATPLGQRPPGTLRHLEDVLALLTCAGFTGDDALHIYRAPSTLQCQRRWRSAPEVVIIGSVCGSGPPDGVYVGPAVADADELSTGSAF